MLKSKIMTDPIDLYIDKIEKHIKNIFNDCTQFNIKNRSYIEQMYNGDIKWKVLRWNDNTLKISIETNYIELPISAIVFCLYQLSVACGIDSDDWNNNYLEEIIVQNFISYIKAYFIMEYV